MNNQPKLAVIIGHALLMCIITALGAVASLFAVLPIGADVPMGIVYALLFFISIICLIMGIVGKKHRVVQVFAYILPFTVGLVAGRLFLHLMFTWWAIADIPSYLMIGLSLVSSAGIVAWMSRLGYRSKKEGKAIGEKSPFVFIGIACFSLLSASIMYTSLIEYIPFGYVIFCIVTLLLFIPFLMYSFRHAKYMKENASSMTEKDVPVHAVILYVNLFSILITILKTATILIAIWQIFSFITDFLSFLG